MLIKVLSEISSYLLTELQKCYGATFCHTR